MHPPNESPAAIAVARGVPECDLVGTMISDESSRSLESTQRACVHCGASFQSRAAGKPQKFCSARCRRAHHDAKPARVKRAQTCKAPENAPVRSDSGVLLNAQEALHYEFCAGALMLTQFDSLGNETVTIQIAEDQIHSFIERLCDLIGIGGVR